MLQITLENREVGETRALVILSVSVSQRGDKDSSGGLTRRRRSGGWTLNFLCRQEAGTRQAMSWQKQAKINSGAEESIQHGCQRTVKLPSMMDSLDVHSLFAARLWSSE